MLYLHHKVGGGFAECLHHGHGLSVEQRHPVGHLVVDLVLNLQLREQRAEGAGESSLPPFLMD